MVDVLPAPWNATSRVHEYGGGSWAADDRGLLVFVEFADQRLYVLQPGTDAPVPLTPVGIDDTAYRFGDLTLVGSDVVLGTRRAVKVEGTIDGHPFAATLMPSGRGPHWLPLRAAICRDIGKSRAGEEVAVHLQQRTS